MHGKRVASLKSSPQDPTVAVDSQRQLILGSGERAKQLEAMPDFTARVLDIQRSRDCESLVQSNVVFMGERLPKMLPPFIKWPIWKARPQRLDTEPTSLQQLKNGIALKSRAVPSETYSLGTQPRISLTATYIRGELGSLDRKHVIGLIHHAAKAGADNEADTYRITSSRLAELIGAKHGDRFRERLAASLWRMGGVSIQLAESDPLANSWTSIGFALLPLVRVEKHGRETHIVYDLPAQAKQFIQQGKLATVDMMRLEALASPCAESLYLLLYDLGQFYYGKSIVYRIEDLAQRLGIKVNKHAVQSAFYDNWSMVRCSIDDACERVAKYAGFLRDWSVEGRGMETTYTFFYADRSCRLHMPPNTTP